VAILARCSSIASANSTGVLPLALPSALFLPRSSFRQAAGVGGAPVPSARFRVIVRNMRGVRTAVSRRAMLRGLTSAGCALAVGGCVGMAANGPRFDASAISERPMLLVATTRKPVNGARAKPWFGPERASTMNVARAKLVPPDDGRFSLASVGLVDWRVDSVEPLPQIRDLIGQAAGGDVLLYVHGFNQTFESASLDAARLSDGIKFAGETMFFPGRPRRSS
jgi:hypothetical protein